MTLQSDAQTVATTVSHINEVNQEVGSRLSLLKNNLTAASAGWNGSAKAAFDRLMIGWDADANKLNRALADMSEAIRQSNASFEASQEEHVSQLTQAAAGEGGSSLSGL